MYKKLIWLAVFIAIPAFASGKDMPRGKWWRNANTAATMKLSQEEIKMLDQKYVDSHRKLIQLKGDLELERFELEVLMDKDPLDEAGVIEQFKQMNSARDSLATERFRFLLDVRKLLGAERFQQLKTEFQKRKRHKQARRKSGRRERGEGRQDQGRPPGPPPAE